MENTENDVKNRELLGGLEISSTKDIEVPKKMIDQVIGQ